MDIKNAQDKVEGIIESCGGHWKPLSILARLTEELGELARAVNIQHGEKQKRHDKDGDELAEELSDVLFTTLAMASALNIDLEKTLANKINKDKEKRRKLYNSDK